MSEPLKLKLQNAIFSVLNGAFKDPGDLDSQIFEDLTASLKFQTDKVLGEVGIALDKLRDIDGNAIDVTPFSNGPLQAISTSMLLNSQSIKDAKAAKLNAFLTVQSQDIDTDELKVCLNPNIRFDDYTKSIINSTLDESIPIIGKTKIIDAIALLKLLVEHPLFLKRIFEGSLKINGNTVNPCDRVDINSIKFLQSILVIINQAPLKRIVIVNGRRTESRIFNQSDVSTWLLGLHELITSSDKLDKATEEIKKLEATIPTGFITQYIFNSFLIIDSPIVDVETEKTPYISLDAGLLGTWNTLRENGETRGANAYFFSYQAANIYFQPVNKRARLRSFKAPYSFLKGFSSHLGIAQFLSVDKGTRIDNSLGAVGNLLIGCGYRFNRVTKIGLSGVFLKVKDINPIVDRSRLTPFVSLNFSVDLNVAKAFGDVGKALKLFN